MFPVLAVMLHGPRGKDNSRESANISRSLRDKSEPFSGTDAYYFVSLCRLDKHSVREIMERLIPRMQAFTECHAIPPFIRIFATLSFYATGTY